MERKNPNGRNTTGWGLFLLLVGMIIAFGDISIGEAAKPGKNGISPQFAVYRNGQFLLKYATIPTTNPPPDHTVSFPGGGTGVVGDFNGDTFADLALYNAGVWTISFSKLDVFGVRCSSTSNIANPLVVSFGTGAEVPRAADMNGDGLDDLVLYTPIQGSGRWRVKYNRGGCAPFPTSDPPQELAPFRTDQSGYIPVLGDFDGNNTIDRAVFSKGFWFLDTNRIGGVDKTCGFGLATTPQDIPLAADFNGDGTDDLVLFRDGTWFVNYVFASSNGSIQCSGLTDLRYSFGQAGDRPFVGVFYLTFGFQSIPPYPSLAPSYQRVTATVGDYQNNDGWVEPLGAQNVVTPLGIRTLQAVDLSSLGLGSLFSTGRANRDTRFADFDGDGILDLVSNVYSDPANISSFTRLFRGLGSGTFLEQTALWLGPLNGAIRGHGETIVVADFDNDNDVDIFLPHYSYGNDAGNLQGTCLTESPGGRNYLLRNNGVGQFTDVAAAAGVLMDRVHCYSRSEGAQAIDYDGDGWIDLYVAGSLLRNNGNLTFTNQTQVLGLPSSNLGSKVRPLFDERIKFPGRNNDGRLDLLIHHPTGSERLFEFTGTQFVEKTSTAFLDSFSGTLLSAAYASYGTNVYDLNNDGREDIRISGGPPGPDCLARTYLNIGTRFVRARTNGVDPWCGGSGSYAFGDTNGDGRIDMSFIEVTAGGSRLLHFTNLTNTTNTWFSVEVLGPNGERNQFGRVITAWPASQPTLKLTRVVDGGSGYMSQSPYPVLIGTPYNEPHTVQVRYQDRIVTFSIDPRTQKRARVFRNGAVTIN